MPIFNVTVPVKVFVTQQIEAEDIDSAEEKAHDIDFSLTPFVGNGSTDRLCGVYEGYLECESEPNYDEMEIIEA